MPPVPPASPPTDVPSMAPAPAITGSDRPVAGNRRTRIRLVLIAGLFLSLAVFLVGVTLALTPTGKFTTLSASIGTVGFMGFLAVCAVGGYLDSWAWTGVGPATYPKVEGEDYLPGKTLWDALQLLIIPLALAVLGLWFTTRQNAADERRNELQHQSDQAIASQQRTTDLNIADARQKDGILDAYLDHISDLVLVQGLGAKGKPGQVNAAAAIANARTLAALRRLDNTRNAFLSSFLVNSKLSRYLNFSNNDLARARLARTSFQSVNFQRSTLTNVDFYGAHLEKAHFNNATLTGADFNGAFLDGANFSGADTDLTGAAFKNASLEDAYFNNANLDNTNLTEAGLSGAHLSSRNSSVGTRLEGAILTGATLTNAHLNGVELTGSHLHKANLLGADLRGAVLDGADLRGARNTLFVTSWSGASWDHTICPDGAIAAKSGGHPPSCRGHGFR